MVAPRISSVICLAALRCASAGDASGFLAQRASAPVPAPALAKRGGNPCDDEADGWQCHDDAVVECRRGQVVTQQYCAFYQECKEGRQGLGSASCEEDACEDKADGFFCHDDHVVECRGLKTVNSTACAFYQECKGFGLQASCQEDVCDDKLDGFYCKDDHKVECRNRVTVSTVACERWQDCKDQEWPTPTAMCVNE